MIEHVRELAIQLDSLSKEIKASKSNRLSQKNILSNIRSAVDNYFRLVRSLLLQAKVPHESVNNCDSLMHELLELTHKRSSKLSYIAKIKSLKEVVLIIEKQFLLQLSLSNGQIELDRVDFRIIDTLSKLVPSAALSYEQAIKDLTADNRTSWRGPATDLRETLRETLDYLAPDKEVISQAGFKLERDQKYPTMKQKVRFILRKRGLSASASQPQEDATQAVDEAISLFVRSVYGRSNISTHTPTDKREVLRVRDLVRTSLCELLEIHI